MRHTLRDSKDSIGFWQECIECGLMVPRPDLKGLKKHREEKMQTPCPGSQRPEMKVVEKWEGEG